MSPALIENIATWKLTKFIHMNIFSMLVFVSLLLPLLRFLARYLSRRCLNPKTASVRSANLAGMNLQLQVSCLSKVPLFGSESTIRSECYATPAALVLLSLQMNSEPPSFTTRPIIMHPRSFAG